MNDHQNVLEYSFIKEEKMAKAKSMSNIRNMKTSGDERGTVMLIDDKNKNE